LAIFRPEPSQAKKEQLKREGKLLTPKQKAERAAAEARRQALLSAGNVTIAGLQQQEADAPRKVSYGKRERANNKKPAAPASPAEEKAPAAAAEAKKEEEKAAPAQAQAEEKKDDEQEDVKDSWDASSSEDEAKADVKDSWDASSDEEEEEQEEKKKPAPAAAPAGKGAFHFRFPRTVSAWTDLRSVPARSERQGRWCC
jgi:translation initiation factor 5B